MKLAWLAIAIALGGCSLVGSSPTTRTVSESFFIDVPQHGVALTHSGKMMLTAGPPGIPLLEEKAIRNGVAIIMKMRNADGDVIGFGSELEVFPANANLLEEDVVWDTDWTLVIPGRGTLFLHQREHSGELGPKVIGPTLKSGKPWVGDWRVTSTVGKGVIAGGSGEFEGARGWFIESIRLERFEKKGVMTGTVELAIHRQTSS